MLRRKDILIIAVVLLVAALAYGGVLLARRGQALSGSVDILVDGVLHTSARLDSPQTIEVAQPTGEVNIIAIDADGGVRMDYSSCENQLCVHQGMMSADNWTRRAMGRTIVCLPNRVLVELSVDEGHPSLLEEDLPDI